MFQEWALREAMARKQIKSVVELAKAAGLSVSYTRQIVSGLRPSTATQARISRALGVADGVLWKAAGGEA